MVHSTPIWTGPGHYDRLRAWCQANNREIGPNGFVAAADYYEFWKTENLRRAKEGT